jgi:ActD protein
MAHTPEPTNVLHGVMAEYNDGQALVDAARKTMAQGFTRVEAYSPVPIEDLNTIIHKSRTVLPKLILAGGLTGMATGFALQYWAQVIEYPMNIGGRPLASWTTFIVPSYELTILFASLTAAIGMIVLNGLPQPYHPVFNVDRFSMASSDKFFLVIESTDPKFGGAAAFLRDTGAKGVYDVAE